MPSRRITLEINLNSGTTARDVRNISERFAELQERMRQITTVSQQLGTGIDQTENFLSALGISAEQASEAITGLLLEQQGLKEVGCN